MRCDRVHELIGPFVEGELGAADRKAVAQATSRLAPTALRGWSTFSPCKVIAEVGRETAPEALTLRVPSALASAARDEKRGKKRLVLWRVLSGIVRQVGMLAASCALSVLLT